MVCELSVPQGSVLGPLLISLYVSPIVNVFPVSVSVFHSMLTTLSCIFHWKVRKLSAVWLLRVSSMVVHIERLVVDSRQVWSHHHWHSKWLISAMFIFNGWKVFAVLVLWLITRCLLTHMLTLFAKPLIITPSLTEKGNHRRRLNNSEHNGRHSNELLQCHSSRNE